MNDENTVDKIKDLVQKAEQLLHEAQALLSGVDPSAISAASSPRTPRTVVNETGDTMKVIEGIFDGQNMVGPDGKQYSVPANYASKSKLVEGDTLKLTITKDGSFVYKQIGPVERKRLVGELIKDKVTDEFQAKVDDRVYRLLLASITYFKGEEGDEVVLLAPKDIDSNWAAVENVIKKLVSTSSEEISND
ncbi:hypothetical protein ACFL04_04600 [Patescibacteria group bacterium]